jgi:hypothetical protein
MGFPGLPSDHFWHFLGKWGWANVDWCEATVMGLVTEPANTWSNIAYVIMGVYFLNFNPSGHVLLKLYPWAVIFLGLLSGFYHATNAWITQWGDFIGMYLVASIPLLINLEKLGVKNAGKLSSYFALNLVLAIITYIGNSFKFPIQLMILFFFVGIILIEIKLRQKSPIGHYQDFAKTFIFFGIAGSFSALDVSRILCDPDNHFLQGHAIWHLFSSIGLFYVFNYSIQCEKRNSIR